MANLFKGYKSITDSQFKQYIAQKINEYDEGSNITKERLMNLAENNTRHWSEPVSGRLQINIRRR